jgi:pimeloyl-ACP methyl ester carboxylesterase
MTSHSNDEFRQQRVFSTDGTAISYRTIGTGMPLIVIPGALGMAIDYDELARKLCGQFTVHVVDRRGRGESGEQGDHYSVDKECEDIQAVCTATNATLLLGHSYGGFVALETALRDTRITKIAVYEPGLSVDGSINMNWAPQCQAELGQGKCSDALVTFIHGLSPASRILPRWLFRIIIWMMVKQEVLHRKYSLLHTTIPEHAELARLDNTYPRYHDIAAKVLLLVGKQIEPSNPGFASTKLLPILQDVTYNRFPKLDHLGPEKSPEVVAKAVEEFLAKM